MKILRFLLLLMISSLSCGIEGGHDFQTLEEISLAFKAMKQEMAELKKVIVQWRWCAPRGFPEGKYEQRLRDRSKVA